MAHGLDRQNSFYTGRFRMNMLAARKLTRESMTTMLDRLFPKQETEDGEAREKERGPQ